MLQRLHQLSPFQTPEARRLAILFGVVYFSQGMYHVTDQMVTLTLKDQFGLSAAQVANPANATPPRRPTTARFMRNPPEDPIAPSRGDFSPRGSSRRLKPPR